MKKAYFFLFTLAILCAGCKPDVESCFTSTVNVRVVSFTSTCSIEATSYEWEFGDGQTSISANPVHTYANDGTYIVTLRVADKKGRTSTTTESVTCFTPTPANEKFNGTYSLVETCDSTGNDVYTVTISPSTTDNNKANITGLYRESFSTVVANIGSDGMAFTIPSVDVGPGTIESSGTCTSNATGSTINVVYKFTNEFSNAFESCTAVLTRL